jgi:DtxR family Mn-dependent transcriptional regulator
MFINLGMPNHISDLMPSEQVEEYLETIYDLGGKDGAARTTAIAKCLNLAPASVTEALQNMAGNGLVTYEPYKGATLTRQGLEIATKIKRRHRLLEVFLTDILHIKKEKVHDEACRMEHAISDETENALCKMLNAPSRCPHGSPIGPCNKDVSTCEECDMATYSDMATYRDMAPGHMRHRYHGGHGMNIVPITDLAPCEKGVIAFIRGDKKVVQRLSDLGLTLYTEVEMLRKAPMNGPIEVSVRRTKLAIAREIADNIFVNIAA